jgi:hypothetical protein
VADIRNYSNEETLQLLVEKAKQTGTDSFWIKVDRRRPPGISETVATLDRATVAHIAKPEEWLWDLSGGGQYFLRIGHAEQDGLSIGSMLQFTLAGTPRPADPFAAKLATWTGPNLVTPKEAAVVTTVGADTTQIPQRGVTIQGGDPGAQQAYFSQQLLEAERRHSRELMDMQLKLLQAQSVQKGPSIAELLAPIVGAIAPVAAAMVAKGSEERIALAGQHQQQQAQMQGLVTAILTKKPEADPALERVVDILRSQSEKTQRMLERMAEGNGDSDQLESTQRMIGMFHDMMGLVVKASTAASEAAQDRPSNWTKDLFSAIEGVAGKMFAAGAGGAGGGPVPGGARQLPPRPPAQQTQSVPAQPTQQAQPAQPTQPAQPGVIDTLIAHIRAHASVPELAGVVVKLATSGNEEFTREVNAREGGIQQLAVEKLGDEWMQDAKNFMYAKSLMVEIERQGTAAGVWSSEGDAEPAEEEVAGSGGEDGEEDGEEGSPEATA